MIIKNYKDMCSLLEEKVKTNSKDKNPQLEMWSRYFKYHKDKYAFVIDEVYESPLPEPFRVDDVYSAYIQAILCNYLMTNKLQDNCCLIATKKQIFEICGMVNKYYKLINNYATDDESRWQVNQFNQMINSRLSNILTKSLQRLQKKGYIVFSDYYTIVQRVDDVKIIREATNDEISDYLSDVQYVKNKLHISLINDFNSKHYYSELNNRLKNKYGWSSCYKQTKIIIAKGYMQQAYQESLCDFKNEIEKNKYAVNDNIVSLLNSVLNSEFEKSQKLLQDKKKEYNKELYNDADIDIVTDDNVITRYNLKLLNEKSVEQQKVMIDLYIKLSNDKILQEIQNNEVTTRVGMSD